MSIEAMKLALEALDWHYQSGHSNDMTGMRLKIDQKVLRTLRAALAKAEQTQPVAWIDEYGNPFPLAAKQYSIVGKHWKPLYTAPPQRKPLTCAWSPEIGRSMK